MEMENKVDQQPVIRRWAIADGGTRIVWNVRKDMRLPHRDMLEMSL